MLFVPALRTGVQAHVLDNAENRNVDLLEHLEALARVHQRDVLRRGDDHRTGDRHALRQRQLNVASAGRQVDDEVIDFFPLRFVEQLFERLRDHRAAPDHRCFDVDHETDRQRLHAVAFHRLDALAVLRLRLAVDAEHRRLRRPVDVRVQHANVGAFRGERKGEIGGGGGLAHAALARGDGDDVLHAREELLRLARRAPADHRAPRDVDRLGAQRADDPVGGADDGHRRLRRRDAVEHQRDRARGVGFKGQSR